MTTPYPRYSGTQTNLTYSFGSFSSAAPGGTAPSAIRKLVIVGGGTAGWMAAMILAFVAVLEAGDFGERARERFNDRLNAHFEGTRDYIVTHYKTNTRTDTEYWRANAANMDLSDPLKQLFSMWVNGESIASEVGKQAIGRGYPIFSWYCILAGMGVFPPSEKLRPPRPQEHYPMSEIDDLIGRSALNFRDQREVLAAIPPRRRGESLQIYYW